MAFAMKKTMTSFTSRQCFSLLLIAVSLLPFVSTTTLARTNIVRRAIESKPHLTTLEKSPSKQTPTDNKLRVRFASEEEDDNGFHLTEIENSDEDYEFVLDLNHHDDFDRLLSMLSRSGPAKQEDKMKKKKSSTFLDHDEELQHPTPGSLLADYKGKGFPNKARKTTDQEGSRFDDVQKQKEEDEQNRLEALYFEEIHDHRKIQEEDIRASKRTNAVGKISPLSLVIIISSLVSLLI